jgi:cysteine synthase
VKEQYPAVSPGGPKPCSPPSTRPHPTTRPSAPRSTSTSAFIGEDYAVPTTESTAAIRELARAEGVFVGPVYTGKGLAGLLHHARSGLIPADSNVAFLHTGDTGNLFEIPEVVGHITKRGATGAPRSASTAT